MSKSSKTKKKIFPHLPIALHFYTSFLLIIFIIFLSFNIGFNIVIQQYIESQCSKRIENAVNSCQSFAYAFRDNISSQTGKTQEEIRDNLISAILSSSEISSDASMALISMDAGSTDYQLLWPTSHYSTTSIDNAEKTLDSIIDEDGISASKDINTAQVGNSVYYYRFISMEYSASSNSEELDQYYLLIYLDTNEYFAFANSINQAIFKTMIITIVVSGILSIIISFPIIHSTTQLAKFAGRIGRGDFTNLKGHMISRELNELKNKMNLMADKLSDSDKEQKTFFQNASHELRTPLMSIQGYAEGIKYGVFSEDKQEEAVDIIIDETTRLSNMVENLLSISKMDLAKNNKVEVKKETINVGEMLVIVIDKIRGGFIHDNKDLVTDIKCEDCYIYGNENDLFRMLENIFSNCLRYASKTVSFKCSTEDDRIVFEISDDGPGISPEVKDHIFDRFAKGSDGKHGIGLALAKAICEQHDGTIRAYNRSDVGKGAGAVFEITIPLTIPHDQFSNQNKEL